MLKYCTCNTALNRDIILRSNNCVYFDREWVNCNIYGHSPYVRGNVLWKQLASDIQHAKNKTCFHRMLTWHYPAPGKLKYRHIAYCSVKCFLYVHIIVKFLMRIIYSFSSFMVNIVR